MAGIYMQEHELNVNDEMLLPLKQQGYSTGLAKIMVSDTKKCFPMRFWLVDNSYSMSERDGHKFVETTKRSEVYLMNCTRWEEIQQTVCYHVRMAATLLAPTSFWVSQFLAIVIGLFVLQSKAFHCDHYLNLSSFCVI